MEAPTLCVQGIKDGVRRGALEAEFEAFGKLVRVDIVPGNARRGVPDSRIAFVEFERKGDARKAMQSLNGRYVQGKCVMIQFARGVPGARRGGGILGTNVRRGTPEPIPQCAALAAKRPDIGGPLAAKFVPATSRSESPGRDRDRSHGEAARNGDADGRARSRSRNDVNKRWGPPQRARSRQAHHRRRSRDRSRSRPRCGSTRSPPHRRTRSRSRQQSAPRAAAKEGTSHGAERPRERPPPRHGRSRSRGRPRSPAASPRPRNGSKRRNTCRSRS
mmetsp:Transcript_22212/g.62302  ORF Transcript_22212/g.62302 Transcript_22212/m.62302 type:complete len:275 (+) Transcript_22212:195-1019(+)